MTTMAISHFIGGVMKLYAVKIPGSHSWAFKLCWTGNLVYANIYDAKEWRNVTCNSEELISKMVEGCCGV